MGELGDREKIVIGCTGFQVQVVQVLLLGRVHLVIDPMGNELKFFWLRWLEVFSFHFPASQMRSFIFFFI
jgi:hypothetical protein